MIKGLLEKQNIKAPNNLPTQGYVDELDNNVRIGVWIMPDNQHTGMIETFLTKLVPADDPLWAYTLEVTNNAKGKGAPFKEVHHDKAKIHCWLAWQDEPGYQLHEAVKYKLLEPGREEATRFINWFKRLFVD